MCTSFIYRSRGAILGQINVLLKGSTFWRFWAALEVLEWLKIEEKQGESGHCLELLVRKTREGCTSISKNIPHGRSAQGSGQCGPNVCGRFAYPGARKPRIQGISRFGSNFPGTFLQNSRTDTRKGHSLLEFQESPRQTKPKKGPKRKVHEFPICVNSGVST